MKYTWFGFRQDIIVSLGLDIKDLAIYRYLIDFYHSNKMKKILFNNKEYVWVNYNYFVEENPIFNIKKRALADRLKKLCEAKLLDSYLEKNAQGTYTYYSINGDMLDILQSGSTKAKAKEIEDNHVPF